MQTAGEQLPIAAHVALGPGALLRQAREAAAIAQEDLAQRLRLDVKVIEAVESEDYARLPGPAFIKGYIRSIAKELGIDPASALAQYAALANVSEPVLADFSSRAPAEITSSSKRIKFVSVLLVVVVLILIGAWWQRHYNIGMPASPNGEGALSGEPMVAPEPSIPLPYTYTIVEHSGSPLGSPETWRRQTDGSTPPPVEQTLPALAATDAAADTSESVSEAGAALAPAKGELVMTAARDSWVEVTDLNRKRLHFGLIKGGERVAVTGKAPYDLVIGNAPAVTVSFRDLPVDVAGRAINGVARLSVGEAQ